jgi:hypothetical protein
LLTLVFLAFVEACLFDSQLVGCNHSQFVVAVLTSLGKKAVSAYQASLYPGDRFGFLSAGINLSMPLTWISGSLGNWTVNAGVARLRLGEATATVNTSRNHNVNVGQVGVGLTF